MNLYSFLRKKHKNLFAGAFFAVAFFSSFLLLQTQAHADVYDNYLNLFSGKSPAAALKIRSTTSPIVGSTSGERKLDLTFGFEASFDLNVGKPNPKDWHWDHIRDFDNSDYVFMLRICDTSLTDENKCMFSIVPHKRLLQNDVQLVCNNGVCLPPDPLPKIYHYNDGGSVQNDKFRVAFPVSSLAYLKGEDELDTPLDMNDIFKIGSPTKYKADIWYCGGKSDGEPAFPSADSIGEPNIRQFKKLCGDGYVYFKIAESGVFSMPQSLAAAATETPESLSQDSIKPTDSDGPLPSCGIIGSGTVMGCVAQIIYYLIFNPIQWVAGIIGRAFDFFLGYSISDESYRADVIVTGWRLVRDISNIFFILILVWTGLSTIFGFSKVSMRSVVPQLIINALFINFSLFGARVVVDISNVTARLFYNTMSVCDGDCRYRTDEKTGKKVIDNPNTETTGGYKPLSTKIVASFDPQRIFNPAILSPDISTNSDKNTQQGSSNLQTASTQPLTSNEYAGYFIIVTLLAAFIMFGIAKMFFSVMFMFVGRVIGLYMVMIFAPFAVMTRGGMPLVGSISTELGWDTWKKDLVSYSLLAPIFIFFLYIIYAFINSNFMQALHLGNEAGFMGTVLGIVIPMFIIYMLVQQGVSIAKKFSGKIGTMIDGAFKSTAGLVGGAAIGIASGGLGLVGRGATSALGKTGLNTWAAANKDNNMLAGGVNKFFKWGEKSSFDVRNTKVAAGVTGGLGALGLKTNDRISGVIGLGQKDYIGGNKKIIEEREKRKAKKAEEKNDMSHLTDEQAKKAWEKRTGKEANKKAEQAWEEKRLAELKAQKPELKTLEDKAADLTKKLEEAVKAKDAAGIKTAQESLIANKKEQSAIMTPILTALKEEKKKKEYKETDEYKKGVDKAKQDIKDKHGEIKNAGDLSKAMKYEYAKRMLEDSFTLMNKEKAPGLWQAGGTLTTAGGFAAAGASLAGGAAAVVGGGLVANYIDSVQESDKKVFEKIIGDYEKTKGKNTKVSQLTAKLGEIDKLIDEHIKSVLPDGETLDSIKNDTAKKEKYFTDAKNKAFADAELEEEEYKEMKAEYKRKKAAGSATEDDTKAFYAKAEKFRKAKDEYNAMNNAQANKDKLEEALEKEREKTKAAEDKKKEGDKPKSGDDKSKK